MNRLQKLFADKPHRILSIFYTAGYPALDSTVPIAQALEKAGANMIEIGIPFSDPVADGPTIQESNKQALENGMNLRLLLEQVKEIRKSVNIPVILMGYLNPVLQYGIEAFARHAAAAGVDGLILPDMPMDVYLSEYKTLFEAEGLSNTFLVSPTTSDDRIRKIDAVTESFIYAVSASSTTGAKREFSQDQLAYFEKLKGMGLRNSFLIGFGISNNSTFEQASTYASGAIVGSAFINCLKTSADIQSDTVQFVKQILNS
jgi:tryptophan synthase alpha chain